MTEQEALRLLITPLAEDYECGNPHTVLDWKVIAKNVAIPEALARQVVAGLRAEGSVNARASNTSLKLTDDGYLRYCRRSESCQAAPPVDLDLLKYPQRFHELCRDLLTEEFPRLQTYEGSGGDEGIDGYDCDSGTVFQFHMPKLSIRKDKLVKYLESARKHPMRRWALVTTKDLTVSVSRWLEGAKPNYNFKIEVWGPARVNALLNKHPKVAERYSNAVTSAVQGTIQVGSQHAAQIINTVGPTTVKSGRATIKRAPIPGTVGADSYMKGTLKKLIDRLAEFRSWPPRQGSSQGSIYPAIYKNYLRKFGYAVNDTPQDQFEDAKRYFHERIDNTKLGRINKGKGQRSY